MKKSQIIAVSIALLGLVWILSGVFLSKEGVATAGNDNSNQKAEASQISGEADKAPLDVRVRTLKAEPYVRDVIVTGRTQPSQNILLSAEIDGQIKALNKEEGERVSAGEKLALIDIDDRKARLEETKQLVSQREIEFNAARSLEQKGFNSRIALAQARAALENARAQLEQAKIALGNTEITAPLDGVINQQMIEEGDYIAKGDPLFQIVNLDPIEIAGFVSERQIDVISEGTQARARTLEGKDISGTITFIAAFADEQTRTFRVVMQAPNPDFSLKGGITTELHIPTEEIMAHKISPSVLSLNDAGEVGVKIVDENNTARFVPVTILADHPGHMWVDGLGDNVTLITVGQEFVKEGTRVNPVISDGSGLL